MIQRFYISRAPRCYSYTINKDKKLQVSKLSNNKIGIIHELSFSNHDSITIKSIYEEILKSGITNKI